MKVTEEQFTKTLEAKINEAQKGLDKFRADFEESPSHAMQWSESVFYNTKVVDVYTYFLIHASFERAESYARKYLTSLASMTGQSSSPTHNLMRKAEIAAYANILEMFQ